jgi:hypothetical protein
MTRSEGGVLLECLDPWSQKRETVPGPLWKTALHTWPYSTSLCQWPTNASHFATWLVRPTSKRIDLQVLPVQDHAVC